MLAGLFPAGPCTPGDRVMSGDAKPDWLSGSVGEMHFGRRSHSFGFCLETEEPVPVLTKIDMQGCVCVCAQDVCSSLPVLRSGM